jgi:EF hand
MSQPLIRTIQFAAVTLIASAFALPALAQTAPASPPSAKQAKLHKRLAAADTNKDGALTKAEVDAAGLKGVSRNFAAIDTNKDGFLSPQELRAYRQAKKAAHSTPKVG